MKIDDFFLGIGARRNYDGEGALAFILSIMTMHNISYFSAISSIEKNEPSAFLNNLSHELKAPLHLFLAARLESETPRLKNPSSHVFSHVGCHGVAEAAALQLGGAQAELIVEKTSFGGMTLAITRAFTG